jgi:hypothetical protein
VIMFLSKATLNWEGKEMQCNSNELLIKLTFHMKILILTLKTKERHDTYGNELSGLSVGQASTSRGTHLDPKKYLGGPIDIYRSFFKMPKKRRR